MRKALAALAVTSAALVAPAALAVDVNRDGWHDVLIREQPYLPYANVGSNCDIWRYNSPYHSRLYVKPPAVWGLPRLGRQRVAWRARFYDWNTGEERGVGDWVYRTVRPREWTAFGGGPNAGGGVMITHNQYWAGHQWYDHIADDGDLIKARVEVAWRNAKKRRWIRRTLPVRWVVTTSQRTLGHGQTGTYSGPVQNGTC